MQAKDQTTCASLMVAVCSEPFDSDSWSRFVLIYGPYVVEWCRSYGLQDADARDVAQEVLLQFLKQAGRFQYDPSRRFRAFLRKITHAAWCDWVERRRPASEGSGDSSIIERLEQLPARDDLLARLESEFDRELFQMAMEQVKRRVEPQTWEVFRLLAIEGLSGQETSERTGMRLGSAYAARAKVQRLLKQAVEELEMSA